MPDTIQVNSDGKVLKVVETPTVLKVSEDDGTVLSILGGGEAKLHTVEETVNFINAGVKGAKGDKGDTGDQGIQGIQGVKGDTGPAGGSSADTTIIDIGSVFAYTNIKDAMASITDASASKVYTLLLHSDYKRSPNRWDTFQWKKYVQVSTWGGLRHKADPRVAVSASAPYDFDKSFHGIDFTLCGGTSNFWTPFNEELVGMVFGSQDENSRSTANLTTLLSTGAAQGDIYLVLDNGGTGAALYILSVVGGSATLGNWVNISPKMDGATTGLRLGGLSLPSLSAVAIYAPRATFGQSFFWGANFSYATLTSCNFQQAMLQSANFSNCSAQAANFRVTSLTSASYSGAYLYQARFDNATGFQTFFGNANLSSAIFARCRFESADFTGADLSFATAINAIFLKCNFTNVNFTSASLGGSSFVGAILTGATLPVTANTKALFKAVVGDGNWDAVTTIWTDGLPIGPDTSIIDGGNF